MNPKMEEVMKQILSFLCQKFNPEWKKMMLHVEMTSNMMSYSVCIMDEDIEVLTEEEDEQLSEIIDELWDEYQQHDNNWKEFVMVIDSNGAQHIDFYCNEYSYLDSEERRDVYRNKHFGVPISEATMRFIKNPNFKLAERDKEYHQENSSEYLNLKEELASKSIRELWEMYCGWIRENKPAYYKNLNQGCQEIAFDNFEKVAGFKIPDELKEIYFISDGEGDNQKSGIFFGLDFMPIESIIQEWQSNGRIIDDEGEGGIQLLSRFCISYPEKSIKEDYLNKKWIPFIQDFGGNYIGIDLDPGQGGKLGQIINFGRDEDEKLVIADSLKDYLILLIYFQRFQKVNKSTYSLGVENGHFTDWLKRRYLVESE